MHFEWPLALLVGLSVPLLIGLYLWLRRRRRRTPLVFSTLTFVRQAQPARSSWRRWIPFGLLLASLLALSVAAARPMALTDVAANRTSIVLALDVSRSMCAIDVEPNRLTVAQEAARQYIREQPDTTRIGLVAFAGFAQTVVAPSTDKEELLDAIDRFTTSLGTVIGGATMESLDAIARINPSVAASTVDLSAEVDRTVPTPEGEFVPDIVVLLTDGANVQGIDPLTAAQQAADRRVRVYTIGFGTDDPVDLVCAPDQLGTDVINEDIYGPALSGRGSGGDFGGFERFLVIDEPTLKTIASMTGGEYFRAENADQLSEVFASLPTQVAVQQEETELSVWFLLAGAVLATLAVGLSVAWNRTL